jgi:hypothetical protein
MTHLFKRAARCATRLNGVKRWSRHGAVALAVVLAAGIRPADAQQQVVPLTGTDWTATVTFQSPTDQLFWIPTPNYDGKGSAGTLNKLATFKTNDPLDILFQQTANHQYGGVGTFASTSTGPLRFFMNATILNQTTTDWTGFTETISDKDPAAVGDSGSELHPSRSHFHPSKVATDYNPLQRLDTANPAYVLPLGNGIVPMGTGHLNIFNLLVHDVEFQTDVNNKPINRSFMIREQPVLAPEPCSLTLLGAGVLGLMGSRRRSRRGSGVKAITA